MSELAWRFFRWMCEPSKGKIRAWHFFFWITPRWLSKKCQMYMFRSYAERYPAKLERQVREALAHQLNRLKSEDERAAYTKWATDLLLHPNARNLRFSQIGPQP